MGVPARHWRSGGVLCIVALLLGAVTWAATRADGRAGSQSMSNDGGAWLVKRDAGAVGHLNREVLEVSAGVRVGEPGTDLEVDQSSDIIVVHDRTAGRAMLIDGRTNQRRGDLRVPDGADVRAIDGGIVVHQTLPLRVWRLTTDELSSANDVADVVPLVSGSAGSVAVAPGMIAVYDADTNSVARYVDGLEIDRVTVEDRPGDLTIVGDEVVAAIGDDLVTVGLDRVERPGVGPYELQQSGPGTSLLAVDSSHRVFVIEPNGTTRSFALPSKTSRPVNHEGCVFAIVDGPALVRDCVDGGHDSMPLEGVRGDLRLRVVNGWVWINDLDSGGAWIVNSDAPLSRIDDWGAALAEEEVDESEATVETDGGVEEVRLDPDADDVQLIRADQRDDDAENDPPVARDDQANTRVDRPVVIRVLDNDEDPDGDVLLVENVEPLDSNAALIWTSPTRETVQLTPPAGFVGRIAFRYSITDGRGGTAEAVVTVDVAAASESTNRPPEPVTDVATARAGAAVSLDVLHNDHDPDGDALVLVDVSAADDLALGTIEFDPSGQVTFTPDISSIAGRIELSYVVADDFGATAEGRIILSIRLADSNSPPDARNDSTVTSVGNPARLDVLDNDTDPDGDPLIVARQPILLRGPGGEPGEERDDITAGVQMTSDGAFYFVPTEAGVHLFEYLVSDGQNTDTAQIRIDVTAAGTNQPPIAMRDDVSIPLGATRLVYVLDNDGDPDGDIVDIVEWSTAPGLQIEPVPGVGFRVTVEPDAAPRVTFRYAISDGVAEPVATVVVVSVAEVAVTNQPPIARPDMVEVRPGRSTTVPVLLNDFDPEGGSLSVIRLPPSDENVTYELGADGQSIVITVAPTATSGFRFGYDVTDPEGATTASVVDVRIVDPSEPNRPPIARPDIGRTIEGRSITIGVTANDRDPDGDVITIESIASQPANGTATIEGDAVIYSPADGFTGTDRFTYVIVDAEGARSIGSVQVGVTPVPAQNRPPSANDDRFEIDVAATLDVLANDHDPDGDTLAITFVGTPHLGTIVWEGSSVVFSPPVVSRPTELSFVYEITDGHGNTDRGTVIVLVRPEAEPVAPVANDDVAGPVRGNRRVTVDVLANDLDPDGDRAALIVSSLDPAAQVIGRQLVIDVGRRSTQVRYRITDADGLSDDAIVSVVVVDNAAPTISPVRVTTPHDTAITVAIDDHASDPDDDQLFFTCCNDVTGGVAEIVRSAADTLDVRFTPSPGFVGTATFSFGADDRAGHLVAGSVQITVEPPDNRPPVARDASIEIEAGRTIPFDLSSLVEDPDGDRLRYSLSSTPLGASLSGAVVTLRAPVDAAGTVATLDFEAVDPAGASSAGRLDISVTPVTAASPRAIADRGSTNQGAAVTLDLLTNDIDPLGRGLTVIAVGASPNGTSTLDGSSVTFTPDPDFFGTTTFPYTIHDATGSTDRESVGQVTVDVVGRPGTPRTPSANAHNASATVVWTAPATNGAPIDGYRVEIRSDGTITSVDLSLQNSHTFTGLRNGSDHEFRLQAHNAAGWGEWSAWSSPVRPDTIPDRPATPSVSFGDRELQLTWIAPANAGSAITGHQIEIGGGINQVIAVGSSPYTWRGLTNGTEYQFRVAAVNAAGRSDWSTWSTSEHPLREPAAPATPVVTRGNQFLDIDWSAPNNNGDPVSAYELQIERTNEIVAIAGASTTDYRWASLANGQSQRFRVRASNRDPDPGAWSAWSDPVIPCAVPDAAPMPTVLRGDGQVTVSWTSPSDQGCAITSYTIRANGSVLQTTGVTNSYVFTGLTNGTSYVFQVQAANEEGPGLWSGSSVAVVPAGPPTAPTLTSVVPTAIGELTASWSGAGANGSPILRHEVSINGGAPIGAGATGRTLTALATSTSYDVRVRACNDVGCSNYSATVSATTWGPPGAPVGVNASAGNGVGQVNWSTPSSTGGATITSYRVTLSTGSTLSVDPSVRSQSFTGLVNGSTYTVSVAACNTVGCGLSGTTTFTPTQPPVTVALTRGGPYRGANCASGNCQYMHVEARNLTPNVSVSLSCHDSVDGRFKTVNTTTDGAGSLSSDPCHMGYPGRQVWISITDPVRGQTLSNTLTW